MNSLPKTITQQRRDCDLILNPGHSVPEFSTLITRLPSHPSRGGERKMSHRLHFFVRRQREAGCSTDWHAVTAECVTDGRRDRFASNQLTAPLTTQSINQSIDQMKTNNKHAPLSSVPQPRCRSFSRELVRRRRYSRKLQNRIPVHAGKKKKHKDACR